MYTHLFYTWLVGSATIASQSLMPYSLYQCPIKNNLLWITFCTYFSVNENSFFVNKVFVIMISPNDEVIWGIHIGMLMYMGIDSVLFLPIATMHNQVHIQLQVRLTNSDWGKSVISRNKGIQLEKGHASIQSKTKTKPKPNWNQSESKLRPKALQNQILTTQAKQWFWLS